MKDLVAPYLADHKTAWADSTLESETYRLKALVPLLDKSPEELHEALKTAGKKPYTIKTVFTRLCSLEAWGVANGKLHGAAFKVYMDKHRNRFKHAYVKEDIGLTYDEAKARVQLLKEPYKTMATQILETGLRLSEVYKVKNGRVIGKGGKPRPVYGTITLTAPRSSFSRQLKSVGLKAHMLRKLCATRLAAKGATPADLCKVFGWTSIGTAYAYLQAQEDKKLHALMEESPKGPDRADI